MLKEQLMELDKRLEDIQIAITEIRLIYESQSKRLDKLEHEVFGNGRTGLATQVRAVLWIASGSLGFLAILVAHVLAAWLGWGHP